MNSSGEVGLGTTPQSGYTLRTNGDVRINLSGSNGFIFDSEPSMRPNSNFGADIGNVFTRVDQVLANKVTAFTYVTSSDEILKENVRQIDNALSNIMRINPLLYDYKAENFADAPESKIDELVSQNKNQYGVIAQELKEIYPELAPMDEESGLHAVNYQGLIPIIIKAMQEQQIVIDSLGQEIDNLKNAVTDIALHNIDNNINKTEKREDMTQIKGAKLFQNIPNPATESTTINFDLPKNIKSAAISVYNVNGKMVESISLGQNNTGSVVMQAGDLKPGIYVYSLVADGTLVDSKQMVITE